MDWLLDLGYWGLFIGAFLAATVVPFSSDVLLIALLAAGAEPILSVVIATAGNWLGGLSSYWVGYAGKWEWMQKYMRIRIETLQKQKEKIERYGSLLAFMTWLPGVGDVFAVALGFYKINFRNVALYMLVGKCVRFVAWAVLYYWISPLF